LAAVQSEDSEDFSISIALGLSPEEHAAMSGLKLSHRTTKKLMENYAKEFEKSINLQEEHVVVEKEVITEVVEEEPTEDLGQKTLF
jgi:hypothetical protein